MWFSPLLQGGAVSAGIILDADNGSYSIAGSSATIERKTNLNAGSGAYNITLPIEPTKYVLKWYIGSGWQTLSSTI
jgi:hypothetical protein